MGSIFLPSSGVRIDLEAPLSGWRRFPSRGHRQWPGEAGSTAILVKALLA